MNIHRFFITTISWLLLVIGSAAVHAGDLDDGISLDDPLNDEIKSEPNVQYIIAKAKGRAKTRASRALGESGGMGNTIFRPGTKIGPGVTIISMPIIKNSNVVDQ
jgi:hypothetical protein